MRKLIIFALFFGTLFAFTSCKEDDDDDDMMPMSIVETAQATDDLSSLVAALQEAGLVASFDGSAKFTVFAPTNAAFQELLDSNPAWNSLEDIDDALLETVLLYHVVSGEVREADLSDTYEATLATGPNSENLSLQIQTTGSVLFNNEATPVSTDIEATDGVVHIINKVMLPKGIVGLAQANSNFTSLVAALTRADLTTDYVALLNGAGPFTVFAPTNDAFQALLDSDPSWNTLADIPVATLEAVLNYHVVNGVNVQSDELIDNQDITTVGGTLTTDLSSGAKLETTSGQSVDIIITDVQGANGVIHAVDEVLIP